MNLLKKYDDKQSAIGTKIPSPCVLKYEAEDEVGYFRPMGTTIIERDMFVITSGETGEPTVNEYCDIQDGEVLRIVSQCYGTNGQNPKISDVYYDDFSVNNAGKLSGNTTIKRVSGLGPILSNSTNLRGMFSKDYSATTIDMSDVDFSKATSTRQLFNYCTATEELNGMDGADFSSCNDFVAMFQKVGSSARTHNLEFDVSSWNIKKSATIEGLFNNSFGVKKITGLENIDVSEKTTLKQLFYGCKNLELVSDVTNWDTRNVTTIQGLFYSCNTLTQFGDLTNWNTSNVTSMETLFYNCRNLKRVGDLTRWNTSKVTSFAWTFYYCQKLTNVGDLSGWDTSKSVGFTSMFCGSSGLTNVGDLSGWSFQSASGTSHMFSYTNITNLDVFIKEWDFSNVITCDNMFYCSNIKHIVFPKNIRKIGGGMYGRKPPFRHAETSAVTIPDSVELLYSEAFFDQCNIRKIHLGKNLMSIGESATTATFNDIFPPFLHEITIDPNNQYFKVVDNIVLTKDGKECHDGAMCYFTKTDLVIPEGVEIIWPGSFRGGFGTNSNYQPDFDLGMKEFDMSDVILTGVTFPSTTTFIGDRVLQYGCNINVVTVLATTPPTLRATTFFNNRNSSARIRVPAASVDAYKGATTWSSYASIIEAIPNS